jgi:superfamily I DNA/RNA helicase
VPVTARTIGGPGAGKTTRALEIMMLCLEKIVQDPLRLGFVSFTRAARREAAARAADKFNVTATSLEKEGWFRTLHSITYRQLGVGPGELLTGGPEDNHWLKNAVDDESVRFSSRDTDDDYLSLSSDLSEAGRALALWDTARNLLVPVEDVWDVARRTDDRVPDLGGVQQTIGLYEDAKALGGRLDFCDLLLRFAGRKWTGDHRSPFAEVEALGQAPYLPVWFHDEAQDTSPLTALVFKRLIVASDYVYLFGDEWQGIYSFAGARGDIFGTWPVAREEVLPLSYRCPSRILGLADGMMAAGGLAPRDFRSSREGGEVAYCGLEEALDSIKAGEDTLVLTRTNAYAQEAAQLLDERLIPWRPVKGGSSQAAPVRAAGVKALARLARGQPIGGEDFYRLIDLLPSTHAGEALFVRGTKTFFKDKAQREALLPTPLHQLDDWGATGAFKELVDTGRYKELLDEPAQRMALVAETHGLDAVGDPKCRVSTMHGSKGMEADHVVVLNRIPYPTVRAIEEEEGLAEERRLFYTALTRAKEKLTIAENGGDVFPEL